MLIRDYDPADASAVTGMILPVFRSGDSYAIDPDIPAEAALAYWTGPERRVFVVEDAGTLLGTYYMVRNQKGGGSHVCNCGYITAEAARGRGVARAMLAHSLAVAPGFGFAAMQFNFVLATNTRAIDTWQRAGFRTVGRLPRAFRHPREGLIDALVMFRELT
ncbi:GNAT family N-acetyltransferase [Pseudoponticoccus marisrubri]|uniref:Acetyltransferase n=1 Tax=Pseudoponticoccus marisrubri TaxID=1685382 RepID=A0A0W7WFT4_9RHOB|nr:GNAT family N-acetyltransferase [Pseudoponticoccus marisrubri]KUF09488.1 acetyltransferase [Pseudoponticoccus marisrubri]